MVRAVDNSDVLRGLCRTTLIAVDSTDLAVAHWVRVLPTPVVLAHLTEITASSPAQIGQCGRRISVADRGIAWAPICKLIRNGTADDGAEGLDDLQYG